MNGDSYIKIGTDCHGLSGDAPGGTVDADGGIDTDLFAKLPGGQFIVWAGQQKIRGLDLYVRNVYHECVHKRLYDYKEITGVPDNDGDGHPDNYDRDNDSVPDSIEKKLGTNPSLPNTTGFVYPGNFQDGEVFCRMCERDLLGPETDWASDGFNFGQPSAPNRIQRIKEVLYSHYSDDGVWSYYTKEGLIWVNARNLVP